MINSTRYIWIFLLFYTIVSANGSITIGNTIYQNQPFSSKDKEIFDRDGEGSRVWSWNNAQRYCQRLEVDGSSEWRVASRVELKKLMDSSLSRGGLYVKEKFAKNMPPLGGKYDDIWFWTRDSRSSKVATFINFKKNKIGWADKNYKGYILCTREPKRLNNSIFFEYRDKIYSTNFTKSSTKVVGDYRLMHFLSGYFDGTADGNIRAVNTDDPSAFIRYGRSIYFFGYRKKSKILNIYQIDSHHKVHTIAPLGKNMAYSPIKLGDKLYFLVSSYVPYQTDPPDRSLWVLDLKKATAKLVERLDNKKITDGYDYFLIYGYTDSRLLLRGMKWVEKEDKQYYALWATKANGIVKLKEFKEKISKDIKSIKIDNKDRKIIKIKPKDDFGWSIFLPNGRFTIKGKHLYYSDKKIANLPKVDNSTTNKIEVIYNGENNAMLSMKDHLWSVDRYGDTRRIY